jgi:hypothetical protein
MCTVCIYYNKYTPLVLPQHYYYSAGIITVFSLYAENKYNNAADSNGALIILQKMPLH